MIGFENGKANLVYRTIDHIENEGLIGQRTYYNYDNISSVDTLGNLGEAFPRLEKEQNTADIHLRSNSGINSAKLGETGAYFEQVGNDYVLRDITGAEKFRTNQSGFFTSLDTHVEVVNENYFISKPYGSSSDSPFHLYQVIYK